MRIKGFLDSGNNITDQLGNGGIVLEKRIADTVKAKNGEKMLKINTVSGCISAQTATVEKIIITGKYQRVINYPLIIIYDGILSKSGEYSALLNLNNFV